MRRGFAWLLVLSFVVVTVVPVTERPVTGFNTAINIFSHLARIYFRPKPVGFRKGAEGLAALVRETMTANPFCGPVYVFRAKRADRIKQVFWDGRGPCLFAKRLEDGVFRWPRIEDGAMRLSAAQLSALPEGLEWRRVHDARKTATLMQPG
jgi:transposase